MLSEKSNLGKVMRALVEPGPMSKWEIKSKTGMPYPRIHEAVTSLNNNGYVQVVHERLSQKNLKMKIYGLTFKGAIMHLASVSLEQPKSFGNPNESPEDFRKRLIKEYRAYDAKTEEIADLLKNYGAHFDYPIFQQIGWLETNYGVIIYTFVLEIAKRFFTNPPVNLKPFIKKLRSQKRELMKTIRKMMKFSSRPRVTTFVNHGNGIREQKEIDILKKIENRLDQLESQISFTKTGESKLWEESFAYEFFRRIALLKRKEESGNKPLLTLAENLLKIRRRTIFPLEEVIIQFGENRGKKDE